MITTAFLQSAMSAVLATDKTFYLSNKQTSVLTDFGGVKISFTTTVDGNSVIAKTNSEAYFLEGTAGSNLTVNCINACSGTTPYYSLPLQSETQVPEGQLIKINPYKENDSGEHIRGIMVKFSIPEAT